MANQRRSPYLYLIEGGVWLIFVFLAYLYTFQFSRPLPVYEWGPAHWPRVVLVGMFVASLRLLYSDWRHHRTFIKPKDGMSGESGDDVSSLATRIQVVLIFALPVLYTFLMHKMGFLLVTPFFLGGYMWLMGVRKIRRLLILTICIYSGLVLIFVKLIFTYLPPGAGIFNTLNGKFLGLLM